MINLTSSQLRQAADLKEKIAALETELAGLIGSEATAPVPSPAPIATEAPASSGRRTMSAAHKAKIRAAQALRWAKYHAAKAMPAGVPAKKGGMSAAGRARIAAAQKLRWAKVKAAKTPAVTSAEPAAKKRKISAAGRAAIAAGARARWAKFRAGKK